MVAKRVDKNTNRPARRPATTSQGRENQLASLAMDLAEQQLIDGTASAQVIAHFVKAGSGREVLERERIGHENELLRARAKAIQDAQKLEGLFSEAIAAMRSYQGADEPEYFDD